MAKHTKVDTPVIEQFQSAYFDAFPAIGSYKRDPSLDNWHNYVRRQLETEHALTTLFGRRRRFFGRSFEDTTLREAIAYEPQSMTADEIDGGLLRVWQANRVIPLIQVHDSMLFMYREEEENEIVPWLIQTMRTTLRLEKGREFTVPTEAKVGWNWGDYDEKTNPDGVKKWKGADDRKRQRTPRVGGGFRLSDIL